MTLSNKAIKEFRLLYKKHFGKSIDYDAAVVEANRLINLVSFIQPKKDHKKLGGDKTNGH